MSGGGDSHGTDGGPPRKPALLRIKRRRNEAVTDEIIVATAQPRADPKRLRMDQMLLQLSGLGMTHTAAAAQEPQRRQRFRRVTTVDLVAFQNKTAVEVESMLAAWSNTAQHTAAKAQPHATSTDTTEGYVAVPSPSPATIKTAPAAAAAAPGMTAVGEDGAGAGNTPSTPSRRQPPKAVAQGSGTAERMKGTLRDMAMQRSTSARYMQVRSRRHAHQRQQSETAEDKEREQEALQTAFHIYDLVCTDVDEGAAAERAERRRQAKERASKAASEGAIMMNYLPMVHQFLEQQGHAVPAEEKQLAAATAAAATTADASNSPATGATGATPSPTSAAQQQGVGKDEDADEEDVFVYDVYLPVDTTDESMAEASEAMGVPVVEVEDHDDPFFEADASDHDSEDSNAESFYANSYPDEDEYMSGSDEDEEGWCHVHQRGGGGGPGPAGERWDDEEYDLTKDEDSTFVPHVPQAGSNAASGRRERIDPLVALGLAKPRPAAAAATQPREQGEWGYRVR